MTKMLRVRFVTISMAALLLMQSMIICFSAQRSYHNLIAKSDTTINTIKEAHPESASVDARYFTVTVNRSDGAKHVNLSHNPSVKPEMAQEYAKLALEGDSDVGFIASYRYRIFREPKSIVIIFLSKGVAIDALKSSVLSSVIFSSIAMGVTLVLLILIARWITRPADEAYKKQQQFITSASHELGTPLTVIKAGTDILLSDDPENEWLCDISKQTARLTEMTRNMITLAKLDEQRERIREIEFSISDLAEDVASSYRAVAANEKREFHTEIPASISYKGAENLIRQLLSILLDNAFKYCPAEGRIELRLAPLSHGVSLSVKNTAEHIERDRIGRIFDRFYRSEDACTSGKAGHGLGLSIADSIVKKHRGQIGASYTENGLFEITALLR